MAYQIEEITAASYCRKCPVALPESLVPDHIKLCTHGHQAGDCRHEECDHYMPCPHIINKLSNSDSSGGQL